MDWRDFMRAASVDAVSDRAPASTRPSVQFASALDAEMATPLPPLPPREAAKWLIRICREYGVGLRVEVDGTLVVISNGHAWRGLVRAIEAHVDEIAELLVAGWDPTDA